MSYRWLAIVNPRAGAILQQKFGRDFLEQVAAQVDAVVYTLNQSDAMAIAAQAEDYDGLVAIGGDGTVSEILSGMRCEKQCLAVIPVGTGNCLATDLGLNDRELALDSINNGEVRQIDMMRAFLRHADGTFTSRNMASTAGLGYATDVAILAKKHFARFRGYAYALAAGLVRPRPREIRIIINDQEAVTERLTGLLINNTSSIGSVRPFPAAKIDDGHLDCFLFRAGWIRQCLHDLEMATGFPVYGTPLPRCVKRIYMDFSPAETVVLDGELFGQVTSMEIVCQPKSLSCMVPVA